MVIERYDRSPDAPQGRIHQEDFNQVLGAAGNVKYQKYSGRVSLERIATLTTVLQLAQTQTQTPHKRAHPELARNIATFASNLLAGRPAGTA